MAKLLWEAEDVQKGGEYPVFVKGELFDATVLKIDSLEVCAQAPYAHKSSCKAKCHTTGANKDQISSNESR